MRLSPRVVMILLYMFAFIMLIMNVFSQIPLNEATAWYVLAFFAVFTAGAVAILAWDYIIPMLIPSFKLGECRVESRKFIICQYRGVAEKVGYAMLKVVPATAIGDIDRERREGMLQTIQGLLKGAQTEVTVAYVAVKDRYHDNIVKRLEAERQRLLSLAFKESITLRESLNRIDRELQVLRQVPVILEGFYIALIREYGMTDTEVRVKLEASSRAMASRLEGLSAEVSVVEGEELKELASYLLFGSLVQLAA